MNINFGNKKIYILKLYLPFTSSLASFSFSEKILKLKSKRQNLQKPKGLARVLPQVPVCVISEIG
jgi:hypothetical protein